MENRANILFISLNNHQRRYFRWLGERLAREYNVFYVHYTAPGLKHLLTPPNLPAAIQFTPQEIAEIIKFLLIKGQYRDFGPVRQFLHSRQVLESKAYTAIEFFYNYICAKKIDLVCVWNGTLVPLACATRVARKLGRKTLFFENGYLPNTTTVDPQGVNSCNSLMGKSLDFYQTVVVDPTKLKTIYEQPAAVRALKSKWYHRLLKNNPKAQPEQVQLPARFLFLPFQVHDDTQVLLHSPQIKTMPDLVDHVVPAVNSHNQLTGDNLWLVAKEHPSDFGRVDYRSLKQKYQDMNILFLRYYPTPELIKRATGVITINSSVGIEALVQHKPVFTLGQAFYNVPGIVTHVDNASNLAGTLARINEPVNHQLIDKFLYYLRFHYLADGSWRNPNEQHFASVKTKINALME